MSESKHTPGPWGIEHTNVGIYVGPMRADGMKVASIVAPIEWGEDYRDDFLARQETNALLIAAAPDLLYALRLLVQDVQDYEVWQRPCYAVDVARAAIAKAEGRDA